MEQEIKVEEAKEKKATMGVLTRDAILKADDLKIEEVDVTEEWGGIVYERTLKGWERDQFEQSMFEGVGKGRKQKFENLRARLVALCTVNEKGERLFTAKDAKLLGEKSASALDKCFSKAQELNGMKAEDVEDMVKNSETDQSEDSISD